jgi:hypothetical protein
MKSIVTKRWRLSATNHKTAYLDIQNLSRDRGEFVRCKLTKFLPRLQEQNGFKNWLSLFLFKQQKVKAIPVLKDVFKSKLSVTW